VQRSTMLRVEPLDQGWSRVRHCQLNSPEYIESWEPKFGNPQCTWMGPFPARYTTRCPNSPPVGSIPYESIRKGIQAFGDSLMRTACRRDPNLCGEHT
jgi:hypothetical protein